jgi:serine/threonine-protein kinase
MYSFEYTNKEIAIVMELVQKEGTLKKYVQKNGVVSEERASNFIEEVMEGLKYLHESSILHGDLKPSNILITT